MACICSLYSSHFSSSFINSPVNFSPHLFTSLGLHANICGRVSSITNLAVLKKMCGGKTRGG